MVESRVQHWPPGKHVTATIAPVTAAFRRGLSGLRARIAAVPACSPDRGRRCTQQAAAVSHALTCASSCLAPTARARCTARSRNSPRGARALFRAEVATRLARAAYRHTRPMAATPAQHSTNRASASLICAPWTAKCQLLVTGARALTRAAVVPSIASATCRCQQLLVARAARSCGR